MYRQYALSSYQYQYGTSHSGAGHWSCVCLPSAVHTSPAMVQKAPTEQSRSSPCLRRAVLLVLIVLYCRLDQKQLQLSLFYITNTALPITGGNSGYIYHSTAIYLLLLHIEAYSSGSCCVPLYVTEYSTQREKEE